MLGLARFSCALVLAAPTFARAQTPSTHPAAAAFPDPPGSPPPPPPPPPYATTPPTGPMPTPYVAEPPAPAPGPTSAPPEAYGYASAVPPATVTEAPPPSPPSGAQPAYAAAPVEQPYVAPEPEQETKFPDFSLRIDPLNWIIYGKLGVEVELEAFEWLTIETIPVFVAMQEPVFLADGVKQYSNGLGPLAGASLSAGFWLEGDSFRGTVLRVGVTSYAYRYETIGQRGEPKEGEVFDEAKLSQTRLMFMLGSGRKIGYFSLAGGFGIEYELNRDRRCARQTPTGSFVDSSEDCDSDQFELLRRSSQRDVENLRGPLFPFDFSVRFSLGFVLDRP
jgi:hypothetical protein